MNVHLNYLIFQETFFSEALLYLLVVVYISQVMPEVVNSVGNVVMRHFKHYITERSHRWLKEDNSLEEEDTD